MTRSGKGRRRVTATLARGLPAGWSGERPKLPGNARPGGTPSRWNPTVGSGRPPGSIVRYWVIVMEIFVNGRFRCHKITGVQRYAHEITTRLGQNAVVVQPDGTLTGWRGHLWEQTTLLLRSRRGVLWSPCSIGPLLAKNHVVTFHDLFAVDSPEWYSRAYAVWYRAVMPILAKAASHIIAVSEYTKGRLVERFGVSPSRISVIHNGVDNKLFRSLDSNCADTVQAVLPSRSYLLCVGSLEPRKNLCRLMAAWASVLSEIPEAIWLVVTGSGDRVFRAARVSIIPSRVYFTGYVPDSQLCRLYAGSLGFIYPSLGEGFGFPPLEAMASGAPVITSSVTALPEVCSSAALYVNPYDVSDIAAKIKVLATDGSARARLSVLGLDRAQRFTWDHAAQKTLDILGAVADPGGRHGRN
jgi:glycosyltransferase involved in cell wall biosynthesis